MGIKHEAKHDAKQAARAAMYYGEGAGTRRKLINATVEAKSRRSPTYAAEYQKAFEAEDKAKHASAAKRERRVKDISVGATKTIKNVASGNRDNLSNGVFVAVVLGTAAHQTGLDKVVLDKSKEFYGKAKAKHHEFMLRRKAAKILKDWKE